MKKLRKNLCVQLICEKKKIYFRVTRYSVYIFNILFSSQVFARIMFKFLQIYFQTSVIKVFGKSLKEKQKI